MTTLTTRTKTSNTATASGRGVRTWVMPIYVVFGLVGGAAAMVLTGAWAPTLIGDAGPLARFGLPVARFAFNTAMTLTVAGLIMASLVFPRTDAITRERKGTVTREEDLDSAWLGSVRIAQVASVVWTLSSVAVLVFTYVSTAGGQAYAGNFSAQLGQYVTQVDSGRLWLTIILSTAFASTVIFAVRSFAGVAWAAALSLFPLIPLGLMGHTVGASGHTQAVNSLGLHLLAVIMWVGGIVVLALLAPRLIGRADLRNIVERYSQLALAAVLVVGFSGFMNAVLRVSSLSDWQTPYGMLIIAKTVATVAVAVIGLWHRKFVIGRLGEVLNTRAQLRAKRGAEPTADQVSARVEFWRLLLVETALLAATLGAGIALARSQPPIPQEPPPTPSPAEILSYEPLPPEPTFANYFTQWLWDPLWIVVAVGTSYLYIRGYLTIRKKGGEWPVMRVIWWVTGMALLVYVTCGGPVLSLIHI